MANSNSVDTTQSPTPPNLGPLPDVLEQSIASSGSFVRNLLESQCYAAKPPKMEATSVVETHDPQANANAVKRVAELFGAVQVGICIPERQWLRPPDVIEQMECSEKDVRAVVIAIPMDANAFRNAPSKSVSRASTMGYMQMALVAGGVAEFVRSLGYRAVAHGNSGAVSAPMAEKAGLGEIGRHGMLITQEHGACVRLCKVFTDMPLASDTPRRLGVPDFCADCNRCVDACPANAIAEVREPKNVYEGLVLDSYWKVDGQRCREQWNRVGNSCGICIARCPYTWS